MASLFEKPIEDLSGIGQKTGLLFRKLGAGTVGDLLRMYPRTYEDWSQPTLVSDLVVGETFCVKAVVATPVINRYISGGKQLCRITVTDQNSNTMPVTFFNNPYIVNMLKENKEYLFYGKVCETNGQLAMVAPAFKPCDSSTSSQAIHPVYSQTAGITSRRIESTVKQALAMLPPVIKDTINDSIKAEYDLCGLRFAMENIHFPTSATALAEARKRLMFEELLVLCLGLHMLKNGRTSHKGIPFEKDYTGEYFAMLPFAPTAAQQKAAADCAADMEKADKPMSRLVQGDVGSGKTAVAAACCYSAAKNGIQCAFMAPTEILARQHFENLQPIFAGSGINTALLTGSCTVLQKRQIKEQLAQGQIQVVIGTHALLSDNVEFKRLGLVVTDEQHRFGVEQRSTLAKKGNHPHLLIMSATPIPRTLALMVYGDLDVSVIDQMPPGRQPIDTFLVDSGKRHRMYGFLKQHIDNGEQCYIVCPTVDENNNDLANVVEYAKKISQGELARYSVGLVYGKMKAKDKEEVMADFANGKINVLVSTTVIEVGVDVANATIMVIENAERFGLSQLHQLRGRVGRGTVKSFCILVSNAKNEESKSRLATMCRTNNGFEIAEEDLALRGPGDFFGARQHGLPQMKIAGLSDMHLIDNVQRCAANIEHDISSSGSKESYKGLLAEAKMLFAHVGSGGLT